ncbi:MAG: hypothetical protein MZV49_05695 [Rhodopseudomonas palustris]|nr:hypothetical protein [Rhodopseudomonas palustris]
MKQAVLFVGTVTSSPLVAFDWRFHARWCQHAWLLPIPHGTQPAIPSRLRSSLENSSAVDLSSSATASATLRYGTLLPPVADTAIQDEIRG